ncbi:hypothetical protein BDZ94DRAFT_1244765 [Collybia nuda]|uniref:Uncharacterized protein n=1 Tax=Collybia nuda TaxID=64659 RepID=A0A9P5YF68_9AGAR|nr:hypothetical protein BDZ94DRAFT_1244765 [Collybia nuda]
MSNSPQKVKGSNLLPCTSEITCQPHTLSIPSTAMRNESIATSCTDRFNQKNGKLASSSVSQMRQEERKDPSSMREYNTDDSYDRYIHGDMHSNGIPCNDTAALCALQLLHSGQTPDEFFS